jgi:hypothetical protein
MVARWCEIYETFFETYSTGCGIANDKIPEPPFRPSNNNFPDMVMTCMTDDDELVQQTQSLRSPVPHVLGLCTVVPASHHSLTDRPYRRFQYTQRLD